MESFAKVALFAYDNDTFILHSFQPWYDSVGIELKKSYSGLMDLVTSQVIKSEVQGDKKVIRLVLSPGINRVFKLI